MNSEHVKREFEAYRKDDAAARAILDAAEEQKRSTSPEEDAQFEAFVSSAETHKKRADKLVEMDADAARLAEAVRSQVGDQSESEQPAGFTDQSLIAQIQETARQYKDGHEDFEGVGYGKVDLQKRDEMVRAIADFSDSGALYTTDFSTKVAVYQRTTSPWINLASVINADNGRPINLPNLTADPTAYTPGEGTAITEATPTIGSAALTTTAYKDLSYVSMEAEEDELIGLLGYIAKSQGRSIGLKFGSDLTVALLTAATNAGTAGGLGGAGAASNVLGTATFIGWEDLIDLEYSLAVPYRQVGVWVMSNGMIKKARKYRDAQGQYLWQASLAPGTPPTLDGYPVYEDPYLAAPASATKSVLFGDASAVVIKQMPLRIATSGEFRFNTDQVAIKTVYRAGGKLPDANALAYLVSANT